MEIKEFIEKFADIFDNTDASAINAKTKFRDLEEWDSLSTLGLIALADEEYGVELAAADIKNAETVEDLFNSIKIKAKA